MKHWLNALAFSLVAVPVALCALARPADSTVLIRRVAAVGGSPAVETVGANISSGTTTSSSMTFTCTSNTKLLQVALGFRRNASQTVSAVTWNGQNLVLSTAITSFQLYAGLWYLQNPGAGTGNVVVTLNASSPGFGFTAISFTNATTVPANPGFNATQSVTTSTASATTNANDILVDWEVKQDTTTVQPTLNTAAAVSQKRWNNTGTSTGNSFWADLNTNIASGSPTQTNMSWTSAANHAHVWNVVQP